jgi:hypothetical protein
MPDVIQKINSNKPVRIGVATVFTGSKRADATLIKTEVEYSGAGIVREVTNPGETDVTAVQNKYQFRFDDTTYYFPIF